jgi:poly(3-hydroxyalkanoate) synthetase
MAEQHDGAWWIDWVNWLDRVSTSGAVPPVPTISYGPAPGVYVLER